MLVDLRAMRINRGLTLTEAAAAIGLSRKSLSQIERGRTSPHAPNAAKVAAYYGYQATDIWPTTEAAEPAA